MEAATEAAWDALSDENDIASELSALATDIEEFERVLARILREHSCDRFAELVNLQNQIAQRIEFLSIVFGHRKSWFSEYDAHLQARGLREQLMVIEPTS
jgi:hypothetical protein